ncbi:MAG: hypothetical protein ACQESA_00355 [Patescibacteria group bacterium]
MVSDELKNYVVDNLREGWEKEELEKSLLEAGWPEGEIERVFEEDDVKDLISKQEDSSLDLEEDIEYEGKAENSQDEQSTSDVDVDPPPQKTPESFLGEEVIDLPEIEDPPVPENLSSGGSKLKADLNAYIKNSLQKGFSERTIKAVAKEAGWSDGQIEEAIEGDSKEKGNF